MDYQTYIPAPVQKPPRTENGFSIAALVTGVLAIFTALFGTVYPPFVLASVSITFALLSKGYEKKLSTMALAGFITSLCGIVLNIAVVIASFYLIFNIPEFKQQFDDMCTELYGQTFDEIMRDALDE